jgi:Fe2+ or Zn2+ uptake regulation protein
LVIDELHATVATRLRRVGQRYTTGRRALIEAIVDAERPVTTAELVAAKPTLPQSTTYRSLALLEQAGVVHRVVGTDEYTRFELSEELGGHHHHLVCVSCGGVEDFTPPARFEKSVATVIDAVSEAAGFRVETHRLDLLGTCAACDQ